MTPEQITAQIDEIISSIADAHILIYRLKNLTIKVTRLSTNSTALN